MLQLVRLQFQSSSEALGLTARTLNFGPLLLALVGFIVLLVPAQSRESYLVIAEGENVFKAGSAWPASYCSARCCMPGT